MIVISSLSFLLLTIILHYSLAHENRVKITPVARTENKSLRGYAQNEDKVALNESGEKEGFVSFPEMNITTGSIEVTFFDDEESIKFYRETSWETINGFAWYGEDGNKTSSLNLSVRESDDGTRYAGSASIKTKVYNLVTMTDGNVRVVEVDISSFPSDPGEKLLREGERALHETIGNTSDTSSRNMATGDIDTVVDIMCLYTPDALCRENGQALGCNTSNTKFIATMDSKCELAVEETNTAFRMSGVDTTANLVYSGLISNDYQEEKYMCSSLDFIRSSNDPVYQRVRDLRNQYKADLISILANSVVANFGGRDNPVCGCGDIFQNNNQYAFSVVDRTCATGYYSFAHEIGHNFGCFHDPFPNALGVAYGFKDPQSQFRTIMAYDCSGGCPRILRYSTPDQQYRFNGKSIGSATVNCASEINRNKVSVANYMQANNPIVPKTVPSLTCSNWNQVKVEVELDLMNGRSLDDITFHFSDKRFPNNNLLQQDNSYFNGQSYVLEACAFSGSCFGLSINAGGSVKSYNVKINGISEASGTGSFITKTETISIDATQKRFQGKRCRWLQNMNQSTMKNTCATTSGYSALCPKTCGSCQ